MTKAQKAIAQAVVQALFVKSGQHPETLRRKIEEAFSKGDGELRDAAAMTPFQWAGFLLQVDGMLRGVGLSLRRGVESVDLVTARIETAGVRGLLEELRPPPAESAALGDAAHEVLAFLLLKEGGTVSEMEKVFDTDRRAVVDRLHALGWIEPRGTKGEATVWAIAGPCLAHFGARSAAELREAVFREATMDQCPCSHHKKNAERFTTEGPMPASERGQHDVGTLPKRER